MVRRTIRKSLVFLCGLTLLVGPGVALANVEIIGAPVAATTIRQWGNRFTSDTNIAVSYVEALEEIATAELFVGVYDLAIVEYPMTTDRLNDKGLVQFPLLGIPVAVVVNLPGIPANTLRLNARVLAAMYMGEIVNWNDPRVAELNPSLSLPAIPVVPIAQSDGAAVTLNVTRYLASGSERWRKELGLASGLIWPLGAGEKDGVSAAKKLMDQEGAVGFQSWMNTTRFDLATVRLQNGQGDFVAPTQERFASTFKSYLAKPITDFYAPVNVDGADAWPIMSVVYGQMKRIPEDVPDAQETVQMLTRVLQAGLPPADGLVAVGYQNVAPALGEVQSAKQFGPPQKRRAGQ